MLRYLGLLLLFVSLPLYAADEAAKPATAPPPPDMPQQDTGSLIDEVPPIKPDVTIRKEKEQTVEEYRINGQLYKVKITPLHGKPYYLLYPDGIHGPIIRRELSDIQTPAWVIFSW
jgi:hypothetical protein